MREALENSWRNPNWLTVLLWPLSLVYRGLFGTRSLLYEWGVFQTYRAPIPVIVVGNLTVGGTGKTPLTIFLIEELRRQGFQPGVISRGYGGNATQFPLLVTKSTPVYESGDEPALIVKRTRAPLAVAANRRQSIELLMSECEVDVIISDDGLQHLALARDVEICLLDATSPNRSRYLLPAGPYRESRSRLKNVDLIVEHGAVEDSDTRYAMNLVANAPKRVVEVVPSANDRNQEFEFDSDQPVQAVAGIGNPQRFFDTCRKLGIDHVPHVFVDHHHYSYGDIDLEGTVLMTEKDAVKCTEFADHRHWFLPVDAKLSENFARAFGRVIKTKFAK